MKRIIALISCGAILFSSAGCSNKPPRGDFDYMPSSQASNSNLNSISEQTSSGSVNPAVDSVAKDMIADPLSDQGKKVQDVIAAEFKDTNVIEFHKKTDSSDIGLTALITVNDVSEGTPSNYIDIAKKAFISTKISESKYSSIGFSINIPSEGLAILSMTKDAKSGGWTSDILAFSGSHKSDFELAYNKSAFFSDLDSTKHSEKTFDEIAKEYGIE